MLTQLLEDDKIGEIRFEIGDWDEKELAWRLSALVWGKNDDPVPFKKPGGDSWDLGGNDWSLLVSGESQPRIARLTYRYGAAYPLAYWSALRMVIEYALHGYDYRRGNFTNYGRRTSA